eukprot:COSAG02_NODE_47143_length_343_cov_0.852459_1_plen_29_part_10
MEQDIVGVHIVGVPCGRTSPKVACAATTH